MLYANANTLTKLKKLYVYGQQDAFLWLFYVHFIGIGLGFRAQPTITSSWNWLENDCLTPVVHISIMLLRPVKWGAKCTTEPTNKQSNDECDAQVNISNGRNLPKLLLIQSSMSKLCEHCLTLWRKNIGTYKTKCRNTFVLKKTSVYISANSVCHFCCFDRNPCLMWSVHIWVILNFSQNMIN